MISRPGDQKTKSSPLKPSVSQAPNNLKLIHKSVKDFWIPDITSLKVKYNTQF